LTLFGFLAVGNEAVPVEKTGFAPVGECDIDGYGAVPRHFHSNALHKFNDIREGI
jgi:hypothetical protein